MHGFQNNMAQFYLLSRSAISNICPGMLKVKETLEGHKLSMCAPQIQHLCIDFKIIWHSCSPGGVAVPFKTFVQVG